MAIQFALKHRIQSLCLPKNSESLLLCKFPFKRTQCTRLRQLFEMNHTDSKDWRGQLVVCAVTIAPQRSALHAYASFRQYHQHCDAQTPWWRSSIEDSMKSWALGTGQPHANLLESPVLLNSDSEPQPIVQYREVNYRHPAWFPTITFRQVAQYSTRPFLTHGQ